MIIELGDNALRDHYHWTSYDIPDVSPPVEGSWCNGCRQGLTQGTHSPTCVHAIRAAYLAVRSVCHFLTDDNHEWEARDYGPAQSIYHERLRELQASSQYSITVREKLPSGEVRYWFHFGYRVPGQP